MRLNNESDTTGFLEAVLSVFGVPLTSGRSDETAGVEIKVDSVEYYISAWEDAYRYDPDNTLWFRVDGAMLLELQKDVPLSELDNVIGRVWWDINAMDLYAAYQSRRFNKPSQQQVQKWMREHNDGDRRRDYPQYSAYSYRDAEFFVFAEHFNRRIEREIYACNLWLHDGHQIEYPFSYTKDTVPAGAEIVFDGAWNVDFELDKYASIELVQAHLERFVKVNNHRTLMKFRKQVQKAL